jgi:hypothetical protein
MSYGAWAMLTIVSVILYGGGLYYISVGYGIDLRKYIQMFHVPLVLKYWDKGPEGRVVVIVGTIVFLLVIEAALVGFGGGPSEPEPEPQGNWIHVGDVTVETGYTAEGNSDEATPILDPELVLVAANLTLGWDDNDVDEPIPPGPIGLAPRNRPDTFRLTVRLPDGTEYTREGTSDPDSRHGEIDLEVPHQVEGDITYWVIDVECVQAGDVTGQFRTWAQDNGNDWSLRVEYTYLEWQVPA